MNILECLDYIDSILRINKFEKLDDIYRLNGNERLNTYIIIRNMQYNIAIFGGFIIGDTSYMPKTQWDFEIRASVISINCFTSSISYEWGMEYYSEQMLKERIEKYIDDVFVTANKRGVEYIIDNRDTGTNEIVKHIYKVPHHLLSEINIVPSIDEILDMLGSNAPERVTMKGLEYARHVKCLEAFFQPGYSRMFSKGNWENCAKVISERSDVELRPYLKKMFLWLQDFNWPGALIIYQRLLLYREDSDYEYVYQTCVKEAKLMKDTIWHNGLLELCQERRQIDRKLRKGINL